MTAQPVRHGTYLGYQTDRCRESCCRAARKAYDREQMLIGVGVLPSRWGDTEAVRAHIQTLNQGGMGYRAIAEAAGLNAKTVKGVRSGETKRVKAATAEAILSVELALKPYQIVDATEARAIVAELKARGWTGTAIGRRVHQNPKAHALQLIGERITVRHLATLRALLLEPVPPNGSKQSQPTDTGRRVAVKLLVEGVAVPKDRATIEETIIDMLTLQGGWWSIKRLSDETGRPRGSVSRTVWRMYQERRLEARLRPGALVREEKEFRLREREGG